MLVSIAVLHAKKEIHIRLLADLENAAYDLRLRLTVPGGVDPRIVIVDLDELSLKEFGWPWGRDRMAVLVHTLFAEYGVETLGLDIVFAEPDVDLALEEIKNLYADGVTPDPALEEIINRPGRDELFGRVIDAYNVVLGYAFDYQTSLESVGQLPSPIFQEFPDIADQTVAPEAIRYTANLPVLQGDNPAGFFSLLANADDDGIIRKVSLINRFQGKVYESLALSVARNYLGTEPTPVMVENSSLPLEGIDIGFNTIITDSKASVFVPYRGRQKSFRYVSARDVLGGVVENPDDLAGTIALLGTSATGLVDLRATPIEGVFPGVEVHANVVASILDGEFKQQPDWVAGVEILFLAITGLLLIFLLPRLSAIWMTVLTLLIAVACIGFNFYLWEVHAFIVPLASTLAVIVALYLINVIYGFIQETRSRLALKQSFGLYVPPEIVDEMSVGDEQVSLNSERRDMTVLFTDVRDFTTISESLDPESLSSLMNAFLTPMTRVVHEYRGAVDKYMGDAMMAFWGAPLRDEAHALHCIDAAMEMVNQVEILNRAFVQKQWPQIKIGIGINSGAMSVGNMGSEFRMAYTVLGDAVNLGARLEGLTKEYGVQIIVSQYTRDAAPGYCFRELDRVRVKGKIEPVRIYEPVGLLADIEDDLREDIHRLTEAIKYYQERQWDRAMSVFELLASKDNQKLYQIYIERIRHFQTEPPHSDWDGVFVFKTK